jgi:hypothetical protein
MDDTHLPAPNTFESALAVTTATGVVSAPITVGKAQKWWRSARRGAPTDADDDRARGSTDAHARGPASRAPR